MAPLETSGELFLTADYRLPRTDCLQLEGLRLDLSTSLPGREARPSHATGNLGQRLLVHLGAGDQPGLVEERLEDGRMGRSGYRRESKLVASHIELC